MRVVHVIHSIDPRSGGPSNVIRGIVREQVRLGYEVSLVSTTIQSSEPWEPENTFLEKRRAEADFAGVELYLGRAFGRVRPWSRYGFSPACGRWLHRRLSDSRKAPSIVHIHGVFSHVTHLAAALARSHSIPYLVEPYGCLDSGCFRMGHHLLKRFFTHWLLRKDLARAAWIHPASQHEAAQLPAWVPAHRIRVVPHGVDLPNGDLPAIKQRFLKEFPALQGKRVVLFLSRIAAIKRPELLVEAVARLRPDHPDLAILVVGPDAGHLGVLREAASGCGLDDAMVYAGFLQGEMKAGALSVADIFALPSLHENFGVAVVEAMAYAVPVVLTPGVASHVYVDQSGGGLTVADNVDAISAGLRSILEGDREAMGNRGRAFVEKHLAWSAVVGQLDMLYRDALARAPQCGSHPCA